MPLSDLQGKILFLAWRREATGAPSGLPASGSATVQLSRLLDHGIERRDWSPRRGSKFHRRTPHKRRAARLWRVVRSFVRLLHLHVHARARTRARVRSREGAKRRPVLEPAKSGRSKELRAAPAATHGRYCASAETTPYIRGNTRYALRPSPRGGDETNQLALDSTSNRYASLVGVDHYQSDWYQRPQRGTTSRGGGASAQRPAPPLSTAGVPAAPGERASALRPACSPRTASTAPKRDRIQPHSQPLNGGILSPIRM